MITVSPERKIGEYSMNIIDATFFFFFFFLTNKKEEQSGFYFSFSENMGGRRGRDRKGISLESYFSFQ